jgi:glycosyltransferase involved in cell wall biosynthesis
MALGGRDRGFKAMKESGAFTSNAKLAAASHDQSLNRRAYKYLLSHYIQVPDAFWTWAKAATAKGRRLLKERNIRLVLTTASPYSCLEVGRALQHAGAKWIADFRDPIGYYNRLSSDVPRVHNRQRKIVANTLRSANALTWTSSCFGGIYSDLFGKCRVDATFIPTGIDTALVDPLAARSDERPYLIFTGEFLPDYDPDFFECFAEAVRCPNLKRSGLKLLVVGTLELNRKRMMPLIDKFGLREFVEFRDQMPQRDLYRLVSHACGGVLLPGTQACWWTNFAKMTDFIGMRKPVVAVVSDPSEARSALTRTGLGIFLDGSVKEKADKLAEFVLGEHRLPPPNQSECERYTVHSQVRSFAEIFDRVCATY